MENKVYKFGYEETDKKIEIDLYGLIFEVKHLDEEKIQVLERMDKNNKNVIEKQIECLLGKGSIDKINKRRREDGHSELDVEIELNILGCIFEAYYSTMVGNFTGKVKDTTDNIQNEIMNFNNGFNRKQRRNYQRNYRRNRNYRRY